MSQTPPADPILRLTQAGLDALRRGDLVPAAQMGEQATRIDPRRAEGWLVLCAALTKMGSVDDERAMGMALQNIPEGEPARVVLAADRASALARRGRAQEAVDLLQPLEALGASAPPRQRDVMGSVYAMVNLFDRAVPHCEAAAAALPDNAMVQYNLGTALRYLGRFDEARTALERAVALDPAHSLAHGTLAQMQKATPESNRVERLRAARAAAGDDLDKARFDYALFKELDDLRRTDEAWAALESGAALMRKVTPFRADRRRARTDALISTFDPARLGAAAGGATRPGPLPIFIVGLPRSGTTLTERILAAHSAVTPMGETSGFTLALRQALNLPRKAEIEPDAIRSLSAADFAAIATAYLANTRYLHGGTPYVTEKLPHNYEWVGLLRLAFPKSPIVHVQRGPMDSLFGALKLLFAEDAYTWSYGLEDLAENFRDYRRIVAHWRAATPGPWCDLRLEDLIADPDGEIRRLLAACGLPFEDACLTPHEVEGGVSTASSSQVRSPINAQGVGAWRRYATQLEPLRAALAADGFVNANGDPTD